jgi:NitT/TauT family transport system substrate-binding protein
VESALSRRAWLAASAASAVIAGAEFARPALAQNAPTIKIGLPYAEPSGPAYYAQDLGLYKKAGLNVELVQLQNGVAIAAAVVGGTIDIGASQILSLAVARLRGVSFTMIAAGGLWDAAHPNAGLIVAPNAPLARGRDLVGRTVASTVLGGPDQLGVFAYVDRDGGDHKAVKFVEMPPSVMLDAVVQGRVDAAHVTEPAYSDAIASKRIRVLTNPLTSIARRFILTAYFTTSDWLAANQRSAQTFAGVVAEAGTWAMNNRQAAADMLAKYIPMKEPRVTSTFGDKLDPALVQPMYDLALQYGFLAGPVDGKEMLWNGAAARR